MSHTELETSTVTDGTCYPACCLDSIRTSVTIFLTARQYLACYAERCISHDRFCLTVRLSVCHTLVSCQNDSSYDNAVFTGG